MQVLTDEVFAAVMRIDGWGNRLDFLRRLKSVLGEVNQIVDRHVQACVDTERVATDEEVAILSAKVRAILARQPDTTDYPQVEENVES
jgi:hypothetical protein